jgi:nucleoid-associated protein YgaU
MIRIALIVLGFIAVTVTLVLVQPATPRFEATQDLPDPDPVTRDNTDFETLAAVSASIAESMAQDSAAMDDVARPLPDVSLELQPRPATAVAATRDPVPAPEPADLGNAPQSALETMIIQALRQGQNETYIDALVNDAANKGTVKVPGALVTADGRVDTATLLTVLSAAPEAMRAGGQIYTVQAGDSLASISYRFFGTTDRYQDIFEANRETMGIPGNITVGQELVIPGQ